MLRTTLTFLGIYDRLYGTNRSGWVKAIYLRFQYGKLSIQPLERRKKNNYPST